MKHQPIGTTLFCLPLLLACLAQVSVSAAPLPAGVRNSAGPRGLNERQRQLLQVTLRQKTGFAELSFDEQGVLTLGHRQQFAGGSATARALLAAAVDSVNLYELESHVNSPDVAFARLYECGDREDSKTGQLSHVYQLQIDFADFERLQGARTAKAALDHGFSMLHELVHGVLKLSDPQGALDQIGDCDAHVNLMRRELQAPERLYYHPDITVVTNMNGRRFVSASLVFVERSAANNAAQVKYRVFWWADEISANARNIAGLQQGTLVALRR